MSEAAISGAGAMPGSSTLVNDWSADKQAYHVPWGKAMMWIFLVSDTFIFTCFITGYLRSEERRVGKEFRSRCAPYHYKKKKHKRNK